MKNKLFRQATALVMSSFVVFLGQASVIASNNQKIIITDKRLGNSERIIAQANSIDVVVAIAVALNVLGQAVSIVESRAIRNEIPEEFVPIVNQALGDAQRNFAMAQSSAEQGDNFAAATALSTGISILGDGVVRALAVGDAGTARALTEVLITADAARGTALAQAES